MFIRTIFLIQTLVEIRENQLELKRVILKDDKVISSDSVLLKTYQEITRLSSPNQAYMRNHRNSKAESKI